MQNIPVILQPSLFDANELTVLAGDGEKYLGIIRVGVKIKAVYKAGESDAFNTVRDAALFIYNRAKEDGEDRLKKITIPVDQDK